MSDTNGNIKVLPSLKEVEPFSDVCTAQTARAYQSFADYPRVQQAIERSKLAATPLTLLIGNTATSVPRLEDNYAYDLEVKNEGIRISSDTQWGAITACSVLSQIQLEDGTLPCCKINDRPTYPWRGLMIDVARHYIEFEKLLQTLDTMALFRLNVLHLHLTDDQGFRFESKRFPKLASNPFYTQSELKHLVDYAADRAIRVVPELDVPGHTTSWLVAYPEWGSKPYVEPSVGFGIHHACLDPTNPDVLKNLVLLFEEVSEVFPDDFVHIGGDEVSGNWWRESPSVRRLMKEHDWTTTNEVQTHFTTKLVDALESMGKRVIGWDEVLDPGLSESVTVQAWRGLNGRDLALGKGHSCIVSSPYYLDLHYPADLHYAYFPDMSSNAWREANQAMHLDHRLAHVKDGVSWGFDFGTFPEIANNGKGKILGGEACMWSELVDTSKLSRRVWSRMPLIAERFWNGNSALSVEEAYQRMGAIFARQLTSQASYENPLEFRPKGELAKLQPLFEQLEPIKWYGRLIGPDRLEARADGQPEAHIPRPYDLSSSLDRIVDFLPPESIAARRLQGKIQGDANWVQTLDSWTKLPEDLATLKSQFREEEYVSLERIASTLRELAAVAHGQSAPNHALEQPVGEYFLPIAHTINQRALRNITAQWSVSGTVSLIDIGNIHDTYVVGDQFVLQKLNTNVFSHPEILQTNYEHIYPRVGDLIPEMIRTKTGDMSVAGSFGVWRLFPYYANRNFSDLPEELCESAGAAFGAFLSRFRGVSSYLEPSIEGFHDLAFCLDAFNTTSKPDSIEPETAFVLARKHYEGTLCGDSQVIHGDCKVTNLLFHPTQPKVIKIIDLDTVMTGNPEMDYGDLIRSIVGTVDPSSARNKIELATQGFLREYPVSNDFIESFSRAPAYMTFMLGVRYLTDHCKGNIYFKTSVENENLQKARARFQSTEKFERFVPTLTEILQARAV